MAQTVNKVFELDIDRIIEKLLEVRSAKPGKLVHLLEQEVRGLCIKAREIFISQPILIELEAPLKICGIYIIRILPIATHNILNQEIYMDNTMIY